MILKFILDIIIEIISFIAGIMAQVIPEMDFLRYSREFFQLIADYSHVAINGLYFIFGEALFVITPFALFWLSYRYLIFPIAVIIRRIFIKGGDT